MKICYKCKQEKPLIEFRRYKSGKNEGYYYSYCILCHKDYVKKYRKKYCVKNPWSRAKSSITKRCTSKSHYYFKRGIKDYISLKDLKFLWFRDKAYLLKQPSIDRIDSDGNYTLKNCRYIELKQNQWKKNKTKLSCLNCNIEYGVYPSWASKRKKHFCSRKCFLSWIKKPQNRKEWKEHISPYLKKRSNDGKYYEIPHPKSGVKGD